jgi:Type III restriction enzyme, res subunit
MSIRVRADQARVHWLVEGEHGVLMRDHALLYVPQNPIKLGQVTRDSAEGLTPQEAFENRYNDVSIAHEDIVAQDIFVIPKTHGAAFDYDDDVRRLVHQLHTRGQLSWDALFPGHQLSNTNSEALIGYVPHEHHTQLLAVIRQYLGLSQTWDTRSTLTWRWQQEQEIEEVLHTLQQHSLCLYAAYTSRGKTKISMEVAHRLLPQGGIVLVTTPITDTKKSYEENCVGWHFGSNRNLRTTYMHSGEFAQHSIQELKQRAQGGELIFVVLTVQDLRWGESITDVTDLATVSLRDKYQALSGNLDLWIRDERHSQYNGMVTSMRLHQLQATHQLDLTATPYNCYDKYEPRHIVSRTLLWGLTHRANTRLPQIRVDSIAAAGMTALAQLQSIYSEEEGYDPRKLFVQREGNFTMEQELVQLAQLFYTNTRSRAKNPLSISNDVELSAVAKRCGMWVLPAGQNGVGAADYLPDLARMLNHRVAGDLFFIDSYEVERTCPNTMGIGDWIQNLLNKHGRVVILTCGKFLTGTDIPAMGHVVLFDKMESVANFEQLMGRMIREYADKQAVKMYTLAPGASVGVTLGRMAKINASLGGGSDWQVLECIPLSEYDGVAFRQFTAEEILSQTQKWFQTQVRNRLPTVSLLDALNHADLSQCDALNLDRFRQILPKTKLSEQLGGVVRRKLAMDPRTQQQRNREQINHIEKIERLLQSVVFEMQWVSYSRDTTNWRVVLQDSALEQMFGSDVIDVIYDLVANTASIETMVREHLMTKQQAYKNLPPQQVYAELFGNSKLKQSIGLVYVPFELAQELVDALP